MMMEDNIYLNLVNCLRALDSCSDQQPVDHYSLSLCLVDVALAYKAVGFCEKGAQACLLAMNKCQYIDDIQKVIDIYKRAEAFDFEMYVDDKKQAADDLFEIGRWLGDNNEFEYAIRYYQRALKIYMEDVDNNPIAVAYSYLNIGLAYIHLNELITALGYLNKSVDIQTKYGEDTDVDLYNSYYNLGVNYQKLNDLESAIEYYKKTLRVTEVHPDFFTDDERISLCYYIGDCYHNCKEYLMAMIYYRKGLDLALTHNDYFENQAQGYCNIGRIHLCQNENDLALDDLLKSLGTYRRVCEENDPRLKDTYSNLAYSYLALGNEDEAKRYATLALDCCNLDESEISEEMAQIYDLMGSVYLNSDTDAALRYYDQAVSIYSRAVGDEYIEVLRCKVLQGFCYLSNQRFEDAYSCLSWCYDRLIDEETGEKSVILSSCCYYLGLYYFNKSDDDKALEFLERAKDSYYKHEGISNPDLLSCYIYIGSCYFRKDDYDNALTTFKTACKIITKMEVVDKQNTLAALYGDIGSVYAAKEDAENAMLYYKRALVLDEEWGDQDEIDDIRGSIDELSDMME